MSFAGLTGNPEATGAPCSSGCPRPAGGGEGEAAPEAAPGLLVVPSLRSVAAALEVTLGVVSLTPSNIDAE